MNDVLVLCYHAVSDAWPADLAVKPARLERQLRLLVHRGYRAVTFTRAALDPPPGRCVAITFDDAYRSVFDLARPLLADLGLIATVFVPTDFPGASAAPMCWPGIDRWLATVHEAELLPMSWDELDELRELGWEIGSHTCSHPHLTQLEDSELTHELADSRAQSGSDRGASCTSLAYPFGDVDARVVNAALHAGYSAGAALPHRWHDPRLLEFGRVGVYLNDADWRFRLKVSKAGRCLRARITQSRR